MHNTSKRCRGMQGMDVSWISRFSEEEERLFYGCRHGLLGDPQDWPLHIASIRLISSASNYQPIMQTIDRFDEVLSGKNKLGESVPSRAALIVDDLLYNRNKFQPFLYQSFQALLDKRKDITIHMVTLNERSVLGSCFDGEGLKKYHIHRDNEQKDQSKDKEAPDQEDEPESAEKDAKEVSSTQYSVPEDNTNIFKLSFLNVFKDLTSISIGNTQSDEEYWPFSLLPFASIIAATKINSIHITADKAEDGTSWISSIWEEKGKSLQKVYENMEYYIDCRIRPCRRTYFDMRDEQNKDSQMNHSIWIKPITTIFKQFDDIFDGWKSPLIQSSLASIFTHLLYDEERDRFSSSIYESFQQCLDNKTEIGLNMGYLEWNIDPSFIDSMFGGTGYKKYQYYSEEEKEHYVPNDGDNTNILSLDLLMKFTNLESISIEAEGRFNDYWSFSLFSLLTILTSTNIKKIDINGYGTKESWLSSTWKTNQSSLEKAYEEKGYSISYKSEERYNYERHSISIALKGNSNI